jgi:hypothetical protein
MLKNIINGSSLEPLFIRFISNDSQLEPLLILLGLIRHYSNCKPLLMRVLSTTVHNYSTVANILNTFQQQF